MAQLSAGSASYPTSREGRLCPHSRHSSARNAAPSLNDRFEVTHRNITCEVERLLRAGSRPSLHPQMLSPTSLNRTFTRNVVNRPINGRSADQVSFRCECEKTGINFQNPAGMAGSYSSLRARTHKLIFVKQTLIACYT